MFQLNYPIEQTDPPRSPRDTLPTMYDLPSENPEEPGLPDEFHTLQPQLLSRTCRSPRWSPQWMFAGADINLYYDVRHPRWYKRPDWFLVTGVPRLYDENDLRLSYVIWQEGIAPLVVVELLSPGTEAEDLGKHFRPNDSIPSSSNLQEQSAIQDEGVEKRSLTAPPHEEPATNVVPHEKPLKKWEVYESILRVPYYIVFSRYTNQVRAFTLVADQYQEMPLDSAHPQVWIPALQLGLGLWQGEFEGVDRRWLRWYDSEGNWVLTDTEQERQEKELAIQQSAEVNRRLLETEALLEQERQEKQRLLERLRQLELDN